MQALFDQRDKNSCGSRKKHTLCDRVPRPIQQDLSAIHKENKVESYRGKLVLVLCLNDPLEIELET